jgi:hypothetical protein
MVSSHAPQTKNWRKFITVRRSFRFTFRSPFAVALARRCGRVGYRRRGGQLPAGSNAWIKPNGEAVSA